MAIVNGLKIVFSIRWSVKR